MNFMGINMVILPPLARYHLNRNMNFTGRNMDMHHVGVAIAPTTMKYKFYGVVTAPTTMKHKICAIKTSAINHDVKFEEITPQLRNNRNVAVIILAGGAGTRLFPLTQKRAKPAVPIGGAYRLIDVPLSNCINSGLHKIYVMTQFNSASLNRHVSTTYNMSNNVALGNGFVEVLAATQTQGEDGAKWFQGTADAVRQFDWLFTDEKAKEIQDVLVLSGDHLYRMDYMSFIENHKQSGADVTVSCLPIDGSRASDFGLMKIDGTGRVIKFSEKPTGDSLKAMEVDTSILGLSRKEAEYKPYIASMGIYVFKKNSLLNMLRKHFPTANDFGSEILPASVKKFLVKAFLFNNYWEDIGTIKSFYEANLALTDDINMTKFPHYLMFDYNGEEPRFNFYDNVNPMYTCKRNLPPSIIRNSKIVDTIVSNGCILDHCSIKHSVIGLQSRIDTNVCLKDTVMFGADFYETDIEREKLFAKGKVPVGIGKNTKIRTCIIDKNARIGRDVTISNLEVEIQSLEYQNKLTEMMLGVQEAGAGQISGGLFIKDGIVIIPKNSTVCDGFVL